MAEGLTLNLSNEATPGYGRSFCRLSVPEGVEAVRRRVDDPRPYGFRAECRDLLDLVKWQRLRIAELGDLPDGVVVADTVDRGLVLTLADALSRADAPLHKAAALWLRRLAEENRLMADALADKRAADEPLAESEQR